MTRQEVEAALKESLEDIFDVSSSQRLTQAVESGDFNLEEFAESSILLTELCLQMEEKLDVELELSDPLDSQTYKKFVDFLCERAGA